ncbi:dihydroflavonol-4-reductase-like protein, partial [Trifolium pratense]
GDEKRYEYLTNSYMVHTDDATSALIFLFECDNANESSMETKNDDAKFTELSSRKLLDSGFKFKYGVNDMYDAAIQSCKEKGIL